MLSKLLKMVVVSSQLHQYDLAKALDVHPSYLSSALKRNQLPDALLRKFAKLLNVDLILFQLVSSPIPEATDPPFKALYAEIQNRAKLFILRAAGDMSWKK